MKNTILFFFLLLAAAVSAQSNSFVTDRLRAAEYFRIGTNTSQKITGFDRVITAPGTHDSLPTSRAVVDFLEANFTPIGYYTAGTGISISDDVITNSAPDQVVGLTGGGISVITGTYPNFTITSNEVDGSTTNELQNLSLSGQSLSISSGTGVTLPVVGVSAGTGIGVSGSGGAFTVSNTGDLSTTNELNTSFSVSGGNLALTDAGGTINVAVSSIAPVQAVSAGTGISISGTTTRTVTNTGDLSATNEIQTLSLSGSDLSLSLGGGTVTLPGGADGNGIYSGDGTIPGAVATLAEDVIFSINYFNGNPGIRVNDEENRLELYSENNLSAFVFTNDLASVYSPTAVLSLEATGNVFSDLAVTPVGIQYAAEYPDIIGNDRSVPDVGLTKQLIASEGWTWPLLAPDGSDTAPSYSFENYPGSGLYRDGGLKGVVLRAQLGEILTLRTGDATGEDNTSDLSFATGTAEIGSTGVVLVSSGESISGTAGGIVFKAGDGRLQGGEFSLTSGSSSGGPGGNFNMVAGSSGSGPGGNFGMTAGNSADGRGGDVNMTPGSGVSGNGRVFVSGGDGFVFPSLTNSQVSALTGLTPGQTVFCSDCTATDASTGVLQIWNGSKWKNCW